MEERLKGNIVLNKSEIDDISHYLKKTQYYIKLELGIFDSEDFNKNKKSKRLSIKNKLKRNK
jgi:replicative DNA helicase